MQDEARHTTSNTTSWGQDVKLRDRPVTFVCAGLIEPLKDLCPQDGKGLLGSPARQAITQNEAATSNAEFNRVVQELNDDVTGNPGLSANLAQPVSSNTQAVAESEVAVSENRGDSTGSSPVGSDAWVPPQPNASVDADSDSTDEVVLFRGRGVAHQRRPSRTITLVEMSSEIRAVETTLSPSCRSHTTGETSHGLSRIIDYDNDSESILSDYIQNMDTDDLEVIINAGNLVGRDLGADDAAIPMMTETSRDPGADSEVDQDVDAARKNSVIKERLHLPHGYDSGVEDPESSGQPEIGDEQLASLLSKQEELGLGSDELVLFSADSLAIQQRPTHRSRRSFNKVDLVRETKKLRGHLSSASAMADAFDEFDLMDWGRTSLQIKGKGRNKAPVFDISDSELEANLTTAWEKDRLRKKEKKEAREDLRANNLLGKHATLEDTRVRYVNGMDADQVKDEIRAFLLGDKERFENLAPLFSSQVVNSYLYCIVGWS